MKNEHSLVIGQGYIKVRHSEAAAEESLASRPEEIRRFGSMTMRNIHRSLVLQLSTPSELRCKVHLD
jgi:hypothetical protein